MLYFHGFGHFHPENEIDNDFLESLDIGTTGQWILDRVGIESRRTVLPLDYIRHTKNQDLRAGQEAALYSNAECGRRAALMAIERAGIQPAEVGMVIAGGCSPSMCIPAEATTIAQALGLEVTAFDVGSACSTFGAQCHLVDKLGANAPEYVLLVTPENMTRAVDFSDRTSAVLFGDGTSAAIVSTKVPARARCGFSTLGSSPAGAMDVVLPRTGHFQQDGPKVHKFAIKKMSELLADIKKRVPSAERLIYVGHQANLTMLQAVARRCEIPPERHLSNIVRFGNQSAAGAPAVISQNWDSFRAGDVVAMVVVGSGLSWSSAQIDFVA
jgi:3-oxoacyl-[acyl-carrier-protein] synthase III